MKIFSFIALAVALCFACSQPPAGRGAGVVEKGTLRPQPLYVVTDVEQTGFLYFSTSNRDGRGRPTQDDDRIMRIVLQ